MADFAPKSVFGPMADFAPKPALARGLTAPQSRLLPEADRTPRRTAPAPFRHPDPPFPPTGPGHTAGIGVPARQGRRLRPPAKRLYPSQQRADGNQSPRHRTDRCGGRRPRQRMPDGSRRRGPGPNRKMPDPEAAPAGSVPAGRVAFSLAGTDFPGTEFRGLASPPDAPHGPTTRAARRTTTR